MIKDIWGLYLCCIFKCLQGHKYTFLLLCYIQGNKNTSSELCWQEISALFNFGRMLSIRG